jgi:hypothetical protein
VVTFTPLPLYGLDREPVIHSIGGWVDPRAGLDAMEKRKISLPCRESNTGRLARTDLHPYKYFMIINYVKVVEISVLHISLFYKIP